jgi:membrane-bound serine protease (ClpP class)
VAWPIILTMGLLGALYSIFILSAIMRIRRMPLPEGTGMVGTVNIVGMEGNVQAPLDPTGTVHVGKESWSARETNNAALPRGTRVKVIGKEGLTLIVEKVD